MTHHPENDHIAPELEEAFRSLSNVSAPPELADRVDLALFGKVQAPAELWSLVQPEVQRQAWVTRVFKFPKRIAAAAAVMVALGIGFTFTPWAQPQPDTRMAEYAAMKAEILGQYVVIEVEPSELSPAAAAMAGSLGGTLKPGGAL
jgi:hypothetical protein